MALLITLRRSPSRVRPSFALDSDRRRGRLAGDHGGRTGGLNVAHGALQASDRGSPGSPKNQAPVDARPLQTRPQRIDVRDGGDRVAAQLLGTGVTRRHHAEPGGGRVLGGNQQEFGSTKVEELGDAVVGDEDVAGLEIRDGPIRLRCAYSAAEHTGRKRPDAVGNGQQMGVAVAIDGQPIDVLHDEIGSAIGAHAAVEETSNVGVVELGQDLTLGAKALSKEMSTEVSTDVLKATLRSNWPSAR